MRHTACSELEHQLEALLFGDLRGSDREQVEQHLEVCEGCREAHRDAARALEALGALKEPPLPYADTPKVMRWLDLQASRRPSRFMAMAAMLLVGILLGRWLPREEAPPVDTAMVSIDPDALASLERAELLADVGVRYVSGLRDMLGELARFSAQPVSVEDAALTRERARSLIRDGGLLTRSLDDARDRELLRAIRRAEPFLEELAAVESSTEPAELRLLQASYQQSELAGTVARLALDDDIESALASSGFLAQDYLSTRKDF